MQQPAILSMFARSPIRPLERHMDKANQCAELLLPFFDAVLQQDWHAASEVHQKITERENEADQLKNDLRLHLPKGLFLPVSRSDLLELLSKQDRIANCSKDIAGIVLGRKMAFPESLQQTLSDYIKRCIDASRQATKAINELDELLESGFKGKEVTLVEKMIQTLDVIETETDQLQIKLRQELFNIEQSLPPVEVMFLYKVIDWIGCIADIAQLTGGRLLVLLAH